MFNTPRERRLASIFGAVIGGFVLWQTVGQMLLQPLTDLENTVLAARSGNATLQEQSATIDHALRNLKRMSTASLPADPGKAAVAYQGWLIRHLETCSIQNAIVTPAPALVEEHVGHRIPFTIQCDGSTSSIAQFLDQFYATPLLHRITNLNIVNASEGEGTHRVTIAIEAQAFSSATDIETLPEPIVADDAPTLLATLSTGDIFRRQLPVQVAVEQPPATLATPTPSETQPEPPKADPLKSIRFVASVWNGKQRVAWFVDQRSKEERTVIADAELVLPELTGKVLSIDDDRLLMEMSGQKFSLQLGQTLSQRLTPPGERGTSVP